MTAQEFNRGIQPKDTGEFSQKVLTRKYKTKFSNDIQKQSFVSKIIFNTVKRFQTSRVNRDPYFLN